MCGPKGYGFFSPFGHKLGIDFCTLVFNSVFFLEEATSSSRFAFLYPIKRIDTVDTIERSRA